MGFLDDDDYDKRWEEIDDDDYFYKRGIYEEEEEEDEDELLEAELEDSGLDLDDLEDMDEDERREAIENAGLDPDDYDSLFYYGGYSNRTYTSSSNYGNNQNRESQHNSNINLDSYTKESNNSDSVNLVGGEQDIKEIRSEAIHSVIFSLFLWGGTAAFYFNTAKVMAVIFGWVALIFSVFTIKKVNYYLKKKKKPDETIPDTRSMDISTFNTLWISTAIIAIIIILCLVVNKGY